MMKQYMEETGKFTVDIERTKYTWKATDEAAYLPLAGVGEREDLEESKYDPDFAPDFKKYDVVISNLGVWAATGNVTIPIPEDFPTAEKSTYRSFELAAKYKIH